MRAAAALLAATLAVSAPAASGGAAGNAGVTYTCGNAICSASPDGSHRRVLFTPPVDGFGSPAWSPDGATLAYWGAYSDTHVIQFFHASTRRVDEISWRVRGAGESWDPSWSPDGTRIAVAELTSGGFLYGVHPSTIKIVSFPAGKLSAARFVAVTRLRKGTMDTEPSWSPDGTTIAFARRTARTASAIFLIHPDGSGERRLAAGHSPSWSPSGTRLAFVRGGSVYEIRSDGSGSRRVLTGLRDPLVRWSPDGAKLLVASGRNAWITDVDGGHRTRILHTRYGIYGAAWQPG